MVSEVCVFCEFTSRVEEGEGEEEEGIQHTEHVSETE